MSVDLDHLTQVIKQENYKFKEAMQELSKVIVGQDKMVQSLFIALLANGHVLVEGLPGLAKTLAVTSLARVINCEYRRIQFTPDLLPADLIGTSVYNPGDGTFSVKKGPIFTNILLADEINRAPAKVQSALLEVMQERQATLSGETYETGNPFFVFATQNPIEHEGTYPLPEAQTDRFTLKIKIDYPTLDEEKEILHRMATLGAKPQVRPMLTGGQLLETRNIINDIFIDSKITDYILKIVHATRNPIECGLDIGDLIMYGASPRAGIAFTICAKASAFLAGRAYATPDDIKGLAHDILRHRIRRSYEAEAEEVSSDDIIDRILETVPVP